ncbi:MAG TPA: choice-of-anchor P family protein, partial [Lacipirellulaceae bacterium]|nr:choice-of-anchor P family protein [Lacipirellulaceae bacterium]
LGLTINGIGINLAPFVGVPVAANTSINLAILGIEHSTLILNEEVVAPDQHSISVNALHLSLNLPNLIIANIVIGRSQAQMTAIPEPASISAAFSAVALLAGIRRKRRA